MSVTLKHNGAEVDLAAARCELGSLVRAFDAPDSLTLRLAVAFDEPSPWQTEDAIELFADGALVFSGRIRSAERRCAPDAEGIVYTCLGPRDQADKVPFRPIVAGTPTARVVYNCPIEEAAAEAGHVALPGTAATVGQIVAHILDSMAPQLAGIIGSGEPGSGYLQAELDAMAAVPPKLVLAAESVDEALRHTLAWAPDFAFAVDPATKLARFFDLRALEPKAIPAIGGHVLRLLLDFTTAGCYSACRVEGSDNLVDVLETLTPAWDIALEGDWTEEKAAQYPDTYGTVWRLFATLEPAVEGGELVPERFVGAGTIAACISFEQNGVSLAVGATASVADARHLLLDQLARQWDPDQERYVPATVRARFAYRKGRVSGRYPPSGHTGSAHARRGLTRELHIVEEERARKVIKGTVDEVLNPTAFKVWFGLALAGELVGSTIEFNSDGLTHTIADNGLGTILLAQEPHNPIHAGDPFLITVQDDTRKTFEGGSLSLLEKYAKETLERVMDERIVGTVPLSDLDWTFRLGQKISFTGTNDPEYEALEAALVALEHDLARQRTILHLTTARLGGVLTWEELEHRRRRDKEHDEHRRQLRRLWRRLRRRGGGPGLGPSGDPCVLDPDGPYRGDLTWILVDRMLVSHIGPGPTQRTIGAPGYAIEWIKLDQCGHVIDAGSYT